MSLVDYWRSEEASAAVEIATLAEVKAGAAVDTDDDDTLIEIYMAAARRRIEGQIGHALAADTYTVKYADWRRNEYLWLPVFPLGSVEDPDGNAIATADRGGLAKMIRLTDELRDTYGDTLTVEATLAWDFTADHSDLKSLFILLVSHFIVHRDMYVLDFDGGGIAPRGLNREMAYIYRRYQW